MKGDSLYGCLLSCGLCEWRCGGAFLREFAFVPISWNFFAWRTSILQLSCSSIFFCMTSWSSLRCTFNVSRFSISCWSSPTSCTSCYEFPVPRFSEFSMHFPRLWLYFTLRMSSAHSNSASSICCIVITSSLNTSAYQKSLGQRRRFLMFFFGGSLVARRFATPSRTTSWSWSWVS